MAISPLLQALLGGGFSGQGSVGTGVGTPPFVPENPAKPPSIGQGSGLFDKPSIFLNLLANSGYSTMPQSPLANFGQAALQTQAQNQQLGMSDLQKRLIESQIGRNAALSDPRAINASSGNVQSVFRTKDGKLGIVRRNGQVDVTDHEMDDSYQTFQLPSGEVRAANRRDPSEVVPLVDEATAVAGAANRKGAEAGASATGKATAEAQIDLPKSEIRAETALATLDKMENHPGLSSAVGLKGPSQLFGALSKPVGGSAAADFNALVEQVSGTAFLEAFQELKGGGHITEIEGQKAEQAIARIRNLDQSEGAYKEAIADLRTVIQKGIDRKRNAAGVEAPVETDDFDVSSMSDEELRRLAGGN